jgi:hypothetical protein
MSILKYNEYLTEKQIVGLLNESLLVYSTKLANLLKKMPRNRIAVELLALNKNEVEGITQNYIDVTDRDIFSFTPDRRVQDMLGGRPTVFKAVNARNLTSSDKNNGIFERLGFDRATQEKWSAGNGSVLRILSETVTKTTGKTYVMAEERNDDGSEKEGARIAVLNKEGLEVYAPELEAIWTTARNPLRIGRMARALLTIANITFTDPELSQFVEQFTATFDFAANALRQFDIVSGDDIHKWYEGVRYTRGGGSLNNSCMTSASRNKLAIYCNNSNVSLVILYDDEGEIVDGKYTSNKIKGRAILWKDCTINGEVVTFMDRIYTSFESDTELFKQFAALKNDEKEAFFFKTNQGYGGQSISDGTRTIDRPAIVCSLDESDFSSYPYMDTMCYIDIDNNKCSNDSANLEGRHRYCQDTGGGWQGPGDSDRDEDEDEDEDWS